MKVRKLWGAPLLAAEWNEEYEEHAASWWELFVDLVLVATCSAIAEAFEKDITVGGFIAFTTTFAVFLQGWNGYCQFSSRFIDSSLLHSFQLFLYLLATSYMVTNTSGFEYLQEFAWSAVLQRSALLFMMLTTYVQLPLARSYLRATASSTCLATVFCLVAAFSPDPDVARTFLLINVFWECLLWWPVLWGSILYLKVELIPLNIDHNAERFGCLIMVVLGESVLSALFDYHHNIDTERTPVYLAAMALSMSLTFAFGLVYYAVEPSRHEHALRRSTLMGMGFKLGHVLLSMALLAVGVGVKLAMHSIAHTDSQLQATTPVLMRPSYAWLLFGATSSAMAAILFLRALHYGGREPKPTDPPNVRAMKMGWWAFFVVSVIVPLLVGAVEIDPTEGLDPTHALRLVVGIVLSFALGETVIQHTLFSFLLPEQSEEREHSLDRQPLLEYSPC